MNLQWQLYLYLKSGQKHRYKVDAKSAPKERSNKLTSEENRLLSLPPFALLKKPRIMPAEKWAIHCSRNQFKKFRRGSKLKNLHLSTFVSPILAPTNNLDLPLREAIFSFAYDPLDAGILEACTRYGLDGYLFQTDEAVKVFHAGDDEEQLIFPTRSEYNMLPIMSDGDGISVKINGEFHHYPNAKAAIQDLESF